MMKIDFIQLESVVSTNTWAKENASRFNSSHLTCITAKEQTAGRGRQEKKWISPKDANLYTTLYFVIPENAPYIPNLGQIMALACAELLLEMKAPVQIKWPNDLLIHKKKIGGVLTETIIRQNSIGVVLGLGLNVNMPESILQAIDQPATSLHLILQKHLDPSSLLQPLLPLFISYLEQLQSEGFAPFQKRFLELLAYKGDSITVHLPQKNVQGVCESITPEGCLRLRLSSGKFLTLSAGEIL
jgi:BirA family transcriptional regulator, biotin operon repressor / biotin---[acetyl-CoA-carboxylase] ligase